MTLGYISNTDTDRQEMLQAIGAGRFEDLLEPIPSSIRMTHLPELPPAMAENDLYRHLSSLAALNAHAETHLCFLGAGIYDHFRPAVVASLASRGEFATAYTPYQPEMSQGMLQAVYEYQTLICALTGMDISNASMYDAATGLAESALMSAHIQHRDEIVVLNNLHPHYRQVIQTYLEATGLKYREVSESDVDGVVNSNTASVIVQNPTFMGTLLDMQKYSDLAHACGALFIVSVDPVSLALLKPPSEYDADIVVGEGQSLGSPMGFGGPLLGFFACKKQFVRSFPGRIVGATLDLEGRRGYTMTLRTREQDIRREKATSNICTNQALLALAATIHLCALGKNGMRQTALLSLQKAHYACSQICSLPGVTHADEGRLFFKEFAVRLPVSPETVIAKMARKKILAGLALGKYYDGYSDALLIAVTENRTKEDIDRYTTELAGILKEGTTGV